MIRRTLIRYLQDRTRIVAHRVLHEENDPRNYQSPEDHAARYFTAPTPTPSSRAVLDKDTGFVCVASAKRAKQIAGALEAHAQLKQIMDNARNNRTNWIAELEALSDAGTINKSAQ